MYISSLSIAKRISLGFASTLLILACIGGYAIFQMNSSAAGAWDLANDYIPEVSIAERMELGLADARVNGRCYQYTGDTVFLKKCTEAIGVIKSAIKDMENLAEKSGKLARLKAEIPKAPQLVSNYEQLLGETQKADETRDAAQAAALKCASEATLHLKALVESQSGKLKKAISDKASAEDLNDHQEKITQLNNLFDMLNALRVANYRSQALRDVKILAGQLENFKAHHAIVAAIKPLFKSPEDTQRIAAVEVALASYEQNTRLLLASIAASDEVGSRRALAAAALTGFGEEIARFATLGANKVANASSNGLSKAYNLTLGGVIFSVILSIFVSIMISRSIVVPLQEIVEFIAPLANGDFSHDVPERLSRRSDELGSLSRSVAGMIHSLTELVSQVQRSGLQVNSSAVEISATTKEQQATAGEVATTSAEISATAKEMSATSLELLKTADSVSTVAEQASELAADGKEGLGRMEKIMRGILDAAAGITAKLGVMNEKAGNINAVVSTIGKVADQTNLLSLNAAIEAEKAGEYGRGFSVVATEIRRLADQTAASTGDIELMVKEMVGAVSAGVMGMDKFAEELRRGAVEISGVGAQLDRVISEVQSVAPSVENVNEGMRSQTQGAQQISEALSQLGESARLTADSIRDSSRAIEQLNDASRGLQAGVSRFKLPV